jgi:tRNA nucleotidyltransferase (CCA-adding enzyme)
MQIYQVGGSVRDRLLGIPSKDRDWVVVGATPEDLERQGYKRVGKDFPVFLHPQTKEEYALARTERKSGRGYKGFEVSSTPEVTLEEDLRRRDLTINAMAIDENDRIIDPFNGKKDLKNKCLRHVSPAFVEDPLRVLRVARFAARLGFTVADETMTLMRDMVRDGELTDLTPERVWQELERALGEPMPELFVQVLRDCGALAVLFPEIDRLFGVPQRPEFHPEIDCGIHVLMALHQAAQLTPDPLVRFAVLVHDLGKGTTPAEQLPRHVGHEERGVDLVIDLCKRYRSPADYRDLAVLVARQHLKCHMIEDLRHGTIVSLLKEADAFRRPERFEQFLLACEADARGRKGLEDRDYWQARRWRLALAAAQSVSSEALLKTGISGPALGEALHQAQVRAVAAALEAAADSKMS